MTGARQANSVRTSSVEMRKLVSLAVAAKYANLSARTLRRYIAQGRLTGYRVGPRLLKVDLREIDGLAKPISNVRDEVAPSC